MSLSVLLASAAIFTARNSEVVVADGASPVVRYAATEATNFLSRVLGGPIPVVAEPTDGRTSLVLGMNGWASASGLSTNNLARDEFIVKSEGARVYVLGRDGKQDVERVLKHGGKTAMYFEQGSLMGTYDFLERSAGVRFYFPGELGEIAPRRASIEVPSGERRVKPDFTSRYLLAWQGEWFDPTASESDVRRFWTLNYLRLRFETTSVPCCHGSTFFGYLKRFGKSHPEYFALLVNGERSNNPDDSHPGQLCWSSDIVEEMYRDAKSYLTGEGPDVRGIPPRFKSRDKYAWGANCAERKYVDIMPQDGFVICRCPRCQAACTGKYGANYATDLIWGVVTNIATRLTREGVDGRITMMAYTPYRAVPDFPLPSNVEVMVAENGPWSVNNAKAWDRERNEIAAWSEKLGHSVWIWTYPLKYGAMGKKLEGVPQVAPRAYARYYKSVAPWIRGAFAEGETDRWFFNYLNYYVFSKLCWDNDVDVEALLKEHHALMFGKGAAAMGELYDKLEEKWLCGALGSVKDTALGPVVSPPKDAELWAEVYSEDFIDWLDGQCDKASAAVAPGSLEARRIELVRREFVASLRKASQTYLGVAREVAALRHSLTRDADRPMELVPYLPAPGNRSLRTTAWARKAGDDLEVVFDCEEPAMDSRAAAMHKGEEPRLWAEDNVQVTINPSGDLENYWHVVVNSEGCWSDGLFSVHNRADRDLGGYGKNLGLAVRVERRIDGWRATLRIPLKALEGRVASFPMEFARERRVNAKTDCNALYHWSKHARGFHQLDNFGHVTE